MNQSISEASEQIEEGERLFNAAMRRMYACLLYTSTANVTVSVFIESTRTSSEWAMERVVMEG